MEKAELSSPGEIGGINHGCFPAVVLGYIQGEETDGRIVIECVGPGRGEGGEVR